MNLTVEYLDRIRDDAVLQVVGEAYRQEFVAAARPPSAADLPPGMPPPPVGQYKALLFPEPTNKFDPNAIAVVLWAGGDWSHVGYLSREDALAYGAVFRRIGRSGPRPGIACDAALVREHGGTGVVLHLGTPGECMAEILTSEPSLAAHPWAGHRIVFTGEARTTLAGALVDRYAQRMLAEWS